MPLRNCIACTFFSPRTKIWFPLSESLICSSLTRGSVCCNLTIYHISCIRKTYSSVTLEVQNIYPIYLYKERQLLFLSRHLIYNSSVQSYTLSISITLILNGYLHRQLHHLFFFWCIIGLLTSSSVMFPSFQYMVYTLPTHIRPVVVPIFLVLSYLISSLNYLLHLSLRPCEKLSSRLIYYTLTHLSLSKYNVIP